MKDRIRTVILILLMAIVWYIFVGRKVDNDVRRYPASKENVEDRQEIDAAK